MLDSVSVSKIGLLQITTKVVSFSKLSQKWATVYYKSGECDTKVGVDTKVVATSCPKKIIMISLICQLTQLGSKNVIS